MVPRESRQMCGFSASQVAQWGRTSSQRSEEGGAEGMERRTKGEEREGPKGEEKISKWEKRLFQGEGRNLEVWVRGRGI